MQTIDERGYRRIPLAMPTCQAVSFGNDALAIRSQTGRIPMMTLAKNSGPLLRQIPCGDLTYREMQDFGRWAPALRQLIEKLLTRSGRFFLGTTMIIGTWLLITTLFVSGRLLIARFTKKEGVKSKHDRAGHQ